MPTRCAISKREPSLMRHRGRLVRHRFLNVLLGLICSTGSAAQETVTHNYEWTPLDRLAQVTTPAGTSSYSYDGDGLRVRKDAPDATTVYVRDHLGRVIAEYDETGNLLNEYVYAGPRRIARISAAGERVYFHADAVGTPLLTTESSGAVMWRGESLPFGGEATSVGFDERHKFAGKELDGETGLFEFGARFYDADLGRFLSVDEVAGDPASPQSWNRYAYSLNNPLTLVDSNGFQPGEVRRIEREFRAPLRHFPFQASVAPESTRVISLGVSRDPGLGPLFDKLSISRREFAVEFSLLAVISAIDLEIDLSTGLPSNVGLRTEIGASAMVRLGPEEFSANPEGMEFELTPGTFVVGTRRGPLTSDVRFDPGLVGEFRQIPIVVGADATLDGQLDARTSLNVLKQLPNFLVDRINNLYEAIRGLGRLTPDP